MLPANKLENIKRRVDRARKMCVNTCAASRHAQQIALALASNKPFICDGEEAAISILAVVEALWKARTELAKLKGE